jgi:hypothetical protein
MNLSTEDLARSYDERAARISQRLLAKPPGDLRRNHSWASDRFAVEMDGPPAADYRSSASFSSRESLNVLGQDVAPSPSISSFSSGSLKPRKLDPISVHGSISSIDLAAGNDGSISDSDRSTMSMPDSYFPPPSSARGSAQGSAHSQLPRSLPSIVPPKLPRMKSTPSLPLAEEPVDSLGSAAEGADPLSPSRSGKGKRSKSRSRHQSLPEHIAIANIKTLSDSPHVSCEIAWVPLVRGGRVSCHIALTLTHTHTHTHTHTLSLSLHLSSLSLSLSLHSHLLAPT